MNFLHYDKAVKGDVRLSSCLQDVKAFANTEDGEEPMDTSTVNESADAFPTNAPFLERPEGQILISRLIQSEKKSGSCELNF